MPLYGDFVTAALQNTIVQATVGEKTELAFTLPQDMYDEAQIWNFLSKSAFFAEDRGLAKLDLITLNPYTKKLTLQWYPRHLRKGLCILPPLSMNGTTLLWPAFQYDFQLPQKAIFNEPILNLQHQPISTLQSPSLDIALNQFIIGQKTSWARQQSYLILSLNALIILTALFGLVRLFKKKLETWQLKQKKELSNRKINLELLTALRNRQPAWELLHRHLITKVEKELGQKIEMTPQELTTYFRKTKNEELLQASMLIQQYAYLPQTSFESFVKAYHLCIHKQLQEST